MKLIIIIAIAFSVYSCVERPRQQSSRNQQCGKYIINVVDDSFMVIKSFRSEYRPEMIDGGALAYRGGDDRERVLVNVRAEIIR